MIDRQGSRTGLLKGVFGVVLPALVALGLSTTRGQADFLDDLFGPSEPAPWSRANTGPFARHSPGGGARTNHRQSVRVKSEVRFMPKLAHTQETYGRSRRAEEERRDKKFTAEAVDTNQFAAGSKPLRASLCASKSEIASATASSLLLYDKTLRAGDILVTDKGVQMFRGQAGCPHDVRNFIALSTADVPKSRRNVLAAIELAMHRPAGYLSERGQ
jgi:hypothetical protein